MSHLESPTAPGGRPRVAHTKRGFFHDLQFESLLSGNQVVDSSELLEERCELGNYGFVKAHQNRSIR